MKHCQIVSNTEKNKFEKKGEIFKEFTKNVIK